MAAGSSVASHPETALSRAVRVTYSRRSMSVLPIVDRELRVAARRAGTYWMRFWAVLAMLAIWLVLLTKSHSISPAQMGQHLLNALGVLALVFCMLAGVFLTSDCLSEEKREGTLGLLFLTDLKAYDVVFGKLAANSLHAIFGLLAVFPILGLALLIGGVTGLEFARLILVLVVTLFFSLSMGMVVSAVNREAKRAVMHAFLLVLFFAGLFPVAWWFQWLLFRGVRLHFLLWASPGYAYLEAFDASYHWRNGAREFWSSMATLFVLGFGGIVLANLALPRSWQEGSRERAGKSGSKRQERLSKTAIPGFHLAGGWVDPMYWLAVRDVSPRVMARRALMFLVPVWFGMLAAALLFFYRRGRIGLKRL
jgi:ABC-type transport system involved in multi-copper enzyme maturation permease subunit